MPRGYSRRMTDRRAKDWDEYHQAVDVIQWLRARGAEALDHSEGTAAQELAVAAMRVSALFLAPLKPRAEDPSPAGPPMAERILGVNDPQTPLDVVRGCPEVCGLVSVADAVRALMGRYSLPMAHVKLYGLADADEIELRNESGASRFSDADLARCPPDGHGGRFVTLRILPGGAA